MCSFFKSRNRRNRHVWLWLVAFVLLLLVPSFAEAGPFRNRASCSSAMASTSCASAATSACASSTMAASSCASTGLFHRMRDRRAAHAMSYQMAQPQCGSAASAVPAQSPTTVTLDLTAKRPAALLALGFPTPTEKAVILVMLRDRALKAGMPQADVDNAIKNAASGGLQNILNWIIANFPSILADIAALINLFGGLSGG